MTYTIRPATRDDSRFIWTLAMDPSVRENSTRSEEFDFASHDAWYAEKLAHPEMHRIWIMEVGGVPVGQVRYGRCDLYEWCPGGGGPHLIGRQAEIAIAIDPARRGQGFAKTLLRETLDLAKSWLAVSTLVALVLRTNRRSRRLFRSLGFRYVGAECRLGRVHARYEL